MLVKNLLQFLAVTLLTAGSCAPAHAQSVADAARAAKEKKQKQSAAAQTSDATPAKAKVITNDEIPEAHSASQPAPSKSAPDPGSLKSSSGSTSTIEQLTQDGLPHGPDSATVSFKFTSRRLKRPSKADTVWMIQNTSDHKSRLTLKVVTSGPCGYHYEHENSGDYNSGQGLTDNFDVDLTVLATDCAGTYNVTLEVIAAGKTLASASDSITAD